jgi:hypothetical protein
MRDVAAEKLLAARDYLSHKPVGAEVHVDGGVNRETAEFVGGLGVDILVVGSVLWIKGRDMGREIRLVRALADEGYQYRLNDGKPPIPRDAMVTFAQLPKHLAWRFMAEIERGGIPVIPLRGSGGFNPDGVRDYDLLVPASAEALTEERHAADRTRYAEEADRWRAAYIAEHGVKPPEILRPGLDPSELAGVGSGSNGATETGAEPAPSRRATRSTGT